MLVVATQLEVVTQFRTSRTERDYERALQMAEAGVNAYQHRLTFGAAPGQPGEGLLPPLFQFPGDAAPTISEFKAGVRIRYVQSDQIPGGIPARLLRRNDRRAGR